MDNIKINVKVGIRVRVMLWKITTCSFSYVIKVATILKPTAKVDRTIIMLKVN